jgi:protease I
MPVILALWGEAEDAMEKKLKNVRIAVLATHGFEESELLEPVEAWRKEGAEVAIVSPHMGAIKGWKMKNWGKEVAVDMELSHAKALDFDALHLPGGVINPDALRMIPEAVKFVRDFVLEEKPVAAICHGPWMLAEADVVRGRTVTSWPSLRTDLINAGATWVDEPVAQDGDIITSRKPDDIPVYCVRTIAVFSMAVEGART